MEALQFSLSFSPLISLTAACCFCNSSISLSTFIICRCFPVGCWVHLYWECQCIIMCTWKSYMHLGACVCVCGLGCYWL